MNTRNNKGFGVVEVILVIAVVALIGLIGWRVWTAQQDNDGVEQVDTSNSTEAPTIKSDEDLDKADKALDETNLEGSESQQLDTETDF